MSKITGQKIKGYHLHERAGTGGFGVVYRASDTNVLNREVAVKIILKHYANEPEFIRRFEVEAGIIASLEHPHIIPLYDFWREPENAYIVLRWMPGGTLSNQVKSQSLTLQKVNRMVEQILPALAFAHKNHIVHRDINPKNILFDRAGHAFLADFGIAQKLDTQSGIKADGAGTLKYMAPEQANGERVTPATDVFGFGLVLFEALTGKHPFEKALLAQLSMPTPSLQDLNPDLPDALQGVIEQALEKEPQQRFQSAIEFLEAYRRAVSGDGGVASNNVDAAQRASVVTPASNREIPNPYKGIEAFQEGDAHGFYGRELLVEQLVARLRGDDAISRFLAVVGPSGSGKSSVARAGLVPQLRQGVLPGSTEWFITEMVPGSHPFVELEAALLRVGVYSPPHLLRTLREDTEGLVRVTKLILPADDPNIELVLVIDQFEELFTLTADDQVREQFLSSIMAALHDKRSRLRVIVTMRADFYDRPLNYPAFGNLFRNRMETVLPLSREELMAAIVEPAKAVGVRYEDGLVDTIIQDLGGGVGVLPLLQFALMALFDSREGTRLTHAAYQRIGGVTGALAQRAEDAYIHMPEDQQWAVRQLFMRLVTPGEGTEDTRRRVRLDELTAIDEGNLRAVIDTYSSRQNRILTLDRDEETRVPTVEIAHEALIRSWERLRNWLSEQREGLLIQRRVTRMTTEWEEAERDASLLASGLRLGQFEAWLQQTTLSLNTPEQQFLDASIQNREDLQRQEQSRQEYERQMQRRVTNRLQYIVVILLIFGVVAGGLAIVAIDRGNQAVAALQESRSRELALRVATDRERLDVRALLAVEAYTTAPTNESYESLLRVLGEQPDVERFLPAEAALRAVDISPDGTTAATVGINGHVSLWNLDTGDRFADLQLNGGVDATAVAFNTVADEFVIATRAGQLIQWAWDIEGTLTEIGSTETAGGSLYEVAYSADSAQIAAASESGAVWLWITADLQEQPRQVAQHNGAAYAVAFHPTENVLATGGADDLVQLIDLDTGTVTAMEGHTNWALALAFSSDGSVLASSGADRDIYLWDTRSATRLANFSTLHSDWVRGLAFAPGLPLLLTASQDNTARLWDLNGGQLIGEPYSVHVDAVWDVRFSPDGERFITAGSDGVAVVLRVQPTLASGRSLDDHTEAVRAAAYSPDGDLIATGGGEARDGADFDVRLWSREGVLLSQLDGTAVVTTLTFTDDSQQLAVGYADGTLRRWDVENPSSPVAVPLADGGHNSSIIAVGYDEANQRVMSVDLNGRVLAWPRDATDNTQAAWLEVIPTGAEITAADFHNNLLATANVAGKITVRDLGNNTLQTLDHGTRIESLKFAPDAQTLASGSRDNTVRLWHLDNIDGQPIELAFHTNWVTGVDFLPGQNMLATVSRDSTFMLWDLTTAEPIQPPFIAHAGWINAVATDPLGENVITVGANRDVWLWEARPEVWARAACQLANQTSSACNEVMP